MVLICRECGDILEGEVLGGAARVKEETAQFTIHIRTPECGECGAQNWMPYLLTAPSDEDVLAETEAASDGDVWRLQCAWSRILRM